MHLAKRSMGVSARATLSRRMSSVPASAANAARLVIITDLEGDDFLALILLVRAILKGHFPKVRAVHVFPRLCDVARVEVAASILAPLRGHDGLYVALHPESSFPESLRAPHPRVSFDSLAKKHGIPSGEVFSESVDDGLAPGNTHFVLLAAPVDLPYDLMGKLWLPKGEKHDPTSAVWSGTGLFGSDAQGDYKATYNCLPGSRERKRAGASWRELGAFLEGRIHADNNIQHITTRTYQGLGDGFSSDNVEGWDALVDHPVAAPAFGAAALWDPHIISIVKDKRPELAARIQKHAGRQICPMDPLVVWMMIKPEDAAWEGIAISAKAQAPGLEDARVLIVGREASFRANGETQEDLARKRKEIVAEWVNLLQ